MMMCVTTWIMPTNQPLIFPTPEEKLSHKDALAEGDALPRRSERPQRALVVDDEPDITFMFAFLLQQSGYEVVTAGSAYEALEAAQSGRFDVVVSDIGMSGMNGYELVEALRRLPGYETVPVIAMTGFAEYADRLKAESAGFNAHLSKPVDPLVLLDLINRLQH